MSTLKRKYDWFNPFTHEGLEIGFITFYKDGNIIANTRWFGNRNNTNNSFKYVEFPFEIKRSTKLNLERKDAFTFKGGCNERTLYIHTDLLPFKSLGRTLGVETWENIESHETFSVVLHGVRMGEEEERDHVVRFDCNYNYELTPNGQHIHELSNEIKELCGVNIPPFQLNQILQQYDITKKSNNN